MVSMPFIFWASSHPAVSDPEGVFLAMLSASWPFSRTQNPVAFFLQVVFDEIQEIYFVIDYKNGFFRQKLLWGLRSCNVL